MGFAKSPELKRCPFCGGEAEITYGAYDENWWGVQCKTCGALVSLHEYSMQDAADAWNRRNCACEMRRTSVKKNLYEFRYLSRIDRRWHQASCDSYTDVVDLVRVHEMDADKIEIVAAEE